MLLKLQCQLKESSTKVFSPFSELTEIPCIPKPQYLDIVLA